MSAAEPAPPIRLNVREHDAVPRQQHRRCFPCLSRCAIGAAVLCGSTAVRAQDTTPAPPPTENIPVVGGPAAPQPTRKAEAPGAQPALAQPTAPQALPPPVPEPPPPSKSILKPSLKIGIGLRTGLALSVNNPSDDVTFSVYDGLADQLLIRPYFSGQLTDNIGAVANFEFGTNGGVGISVLDAFAQVKVVDEFQIWIGQHIPANDRMNLQGPFFHNAWNFEGVAPSFPFDRGARDRGFTFWGLIAQGMLKYQLSMVDLQPGQKIENARYAARVTLDLLDPENMYYASGTYYGSKDVLSIGGVIHYQKGTGITDATDDVPAAEVDNDFFGGSIDLLFEKRLGSAGTFTLQALYWNFKGTDTAYVVNQGTKDSGNGFAFNGGGPIDQAVLAEVTWLSPKKAGIGQLQPGFHFQWADNRAYAGDPSFIAKQYDLSLGYIIDGFNHKWYFNYRHLDSEKAGKDDTLQLGVQFQI